MTGAPRMVTAAQGAPACAIATGYLGPILVVGWTGQHWTSWPFSLPRTTSHLPEEVMALGQFQATLFIIYPYPNLFIH
jgi:hypothetical protein